MQNGAPKGAVFYGHVHTCHEWDRLQPGRGQCGHPYFCGVTPDAFPAKAGPTGVRTPFRRVMHACHLWDRLQPGRGQCGRPHICGVTPDVFPAKAGPTGVRTPFRRVMHACHEWDRLQPGRSQCGHPHVCFVTNRLNTPTSPPADVVLPMLSRNARPPRPAERPRRPANASAASDPCLSDAHVPPRRTRGTCSS